MPDVYFATNRDLLVGSKPGETVAPASEIFGRRFNAAGPQCFRVGVAEARLKGKDPKDDDAWSVGKVRIFAETLDATKPEDAGQKLGSGKMFEELRERLKAENLDVIVYLHGFANTFENSVVRAAALQELYSTARQKVMVVLFSWPSDGQVQPSWSYFSDREDAEASGLAMGRALKRLVEFLEEMRSDDRQTILEAQRRGEVPDRNALRQCTRRLHILAHSMGNWALRHAVRKFVELNEGRTPRVFDCAFLMAADEDHDALQAALKLKALDQLANRVFVYHASNDVALTISDRTKGMADRLGADGPQTLDNVGERVFAVDCREISETALSHGRHQYYRLRPEAIADVQATLAGQSQDDRKWRDVVRPGRSWRLKPAAARTPRQSGPR
ncbi:alpha/beta hydrolase [Amaricoccus sp.]|uniref:alpha/beta hydrolase n=1 Tax=Amaricoccus sp. TaxID=1872485 RepID=UPI001B5C8EA7|nr:alpha/beta hydrolase [Amaricoccus sp.]MBP7000889.1 alpha/beta hydrolase [Amaricoccus sp.]